jgi:hypothetical protein
MRPREPLDPPPSDDDLDRWTERERSRRQAWAEGPSEAEKRDWARAERRRSMRAPQGGVATALAQTESEVEEWAEQERRRRQRWLEGPTEAEKQEWARRERERNVRERGPGPVGPTDEEVEAWADSEARQRKAWLEGPSELEREDEAWAREQAARERRFERGYGGYGGTSFWDRYERDDEFVRRLKRDVSLMRVGAWYSFVEAPFRVAAALRDVGLDWEDRYAQPVERERIRLYDRW